MDNKPESLIESGKKPALHYLNVVLVRPKFSENIGAVARACVNMACPKLVLVQPKNFDFQRALPLATPRGRSLLETIQIKDDLSEAVAPCHRVIAATARISKKGSENCFLPAQIGPVIATDLVNNIQTALVFGPEDSGLTIKEIQSCNAMVSIPSNEHASSLNLAQSVLILLYESFKSKMEIDAQSRPMQQYPCPISHGKLQHLLNQFQKILIQYGFIPEHNSSFFLLPFKRFFERVSLQPKEYKLFMSLCRHLDWFISERTKSKDKS